MSQNSTTRSMGDSWFSDGFRDTQRFDNERSTEPPDVSPAVSEKRSIDGHTNSGHGRARSESSETNWISRIERAFASYEVPANH